MTQTRIFVANTHVELEQLLNTWLRQHRRTNVRFLQLVTQGEANYAILVAWEED